MSYSVLSIDDSGFERKVIANAVGDKYEFLEAETAEEGLKIYEEHKPDIVLLDIRLPDTDGIEILKQLQEKYDDPKVIMVSIVREQETKEEAKELGAEEYVEKPVDEDELVETIEDTLE